MKPEISVVMPAYNNKNIDKNILEVKKELEKFTKEYEIILVNDGSIKGWDVEQKKIMKIKTPKIRVLSYRKNMGKGHALTRGGLKARGSKVVFIDADLDIPAKLIKGYVDMLDNSDVVIGSKRHSKSRIKYPIFRRVMSFFYQSFIFLLFGLNVKDTQVGLKAFRAEVLKKVLPKLLVKRFAFDLELLAVANKEGYKIVEAPVEVKFKLGSTINPKSIFYILLDTAAIFYRLKILRYYDKR